MLRMHALITLLIATVLLSACGGPGKLPGQKIGKPYVINGQSYYPSYDANYDKTGTASWYGPGFHGKYTASGEIYNQNDLTAAHPTLPMPSLVRVTNLENGKSLMVRVNDRGPFKANRLIDLSKKSAQSLGIHSLAKVRVQFLEEETQNYIRLAKANGGRIIPMKEYQQLATKEQEEAAAPVVEIEQADLDTTNTNAVSAPVMSVATDGQGPARQVAERQHAKPESQLRAPRLFVSEAQAAETEIVEAADDESDVIPEIKPMAGHKDELSLPRQAPEPDPVEAQVTLQDMYDTSDVAPPLPEAAPMPTPEAAAPAAGEPQPAETESDGAFTIQAGLFGVEENARKLAQKLEPIAQVFMDPVERNGKTLWRVRAGSFAQKDYASEVLDQVRALVPDAKVVHK